MARCILESRVTSFEGFMNIASRPFPVFTRRHAIDRLVYFEIFDDPISAITREKQVKKWRRDWKIALIETNNPDWHDLFEGIAQWA